MSAPFFEDMHAALESDYDLSCGVIAGNMAYLLRREGHDAQLLRVGPIPPERNIFPVKYGGKIKWGAHIVCIANDVAYDPMLDQPVPFEMYVSLAFDSDVLATRASDSWIPELFSQID